MGSIVNECKQTSSYFNHVIFAHIRREANQAAHYLAKLAIEISSDFMWIEEAPSFIDMVVAFDVMPNSFD